MAKEKNLLLFWTVGKSGQQGEIIGHVREIQNGGHLVLLEGLEGEGAPTEHAIALSRLLNVKSSIYNTITLTPAYHSFTHLLCIYSSNR